MFTNDFVYNVQFNRSKKLKTFVCRGQRLYPPKLRWRTDYTSIWFAQREATVMATLPKGLLIG